MPLKVPTGELQQLRTRDLGTLCGLMDWSDSARGFATPNASVETVLQSLLNHAHWFDALSLLAHALPPRSAIWWGAKVCETRAGAGQGDDAEREVELLAAVCAWVMNPEEEKRIAVHDMAMALPNNWPVHWLGMAVFWATGNITPDAGVVTPPPPYLYARGVSAAIDLAASLAGVQREAVYETAFACGLDIAQGQAVDIRTADRTAP